MKQLITMLTAVQLALSLLTASTLDKDPRLTDRSDDLEVTVTALYGQVPTAWDAETLMDRIRDGSARIDDVRIPGEGIFPTREIVVANQTILAGTMIEPEWLTLRAVPVDETNALAFIDPADVTGWVAAVEIYPYQPVTQNLLWVEASDPDVDRPQPVEVIDVGLTASGRDVNYAVVVRNPNTSRWSASRMPVQIDVLDKEGIPVATEIEFITLLPGQTGAIVGLLSRAPRARGAATLDVTITDGFDYWVVYDYVTGDLDFLDVKTRRGSRGPRTTGTMVSLFNDPQESLQVMAVYRDQAGDILGGDFTFVRMLPVDGAVPFEMDGATSIAPRKVASTEVYFEQ